MNNDTITCPAVAFKQGGHDLYTGFCDAGSLIKVTTVDHYDSKKPTDDPKQGYQRPVETSRKTAIGSYLIKKVLGRGAQNGTEDGFFPTAVILAARKGVSYNAKTNTLSLT